MGNQGLNGSLVALGIYVALCVWVASTATKRNRSGLAFFLLSLFASPILGGILLGVLGVGRPRDAPNEAPPTLHRSLPASERKWGLLLGVVLLGVFGIGGINALISSIKEAAVARTEISAREECETESPRMLEKAKEIAARGDLSAAADSLTRCAPLVAAEHPIAVQRRAYRLESARASISAAKTWRDELAALQGLQQVDPTELTKAQATRLAALERREQRAAEVQHRKQAAALAARKKKEGVRLGMSHEDVIASSWGKPNRVNTTTNRWGTSEQWVYDGGYLYFENGILTSIQN